MKQLSNYQLNMLYQFKLIDYDEFIQKGGKLEEKTMIVNIPSEIPQQAVFEPIGYVTNIVTGEKFFFDWFETVPSLPGRLVPGIYDTPIWVYDSPPVLAPSQTINGNKEYLNPSFISVEDKAMLAELYRQHVRETYQ